MLPLRHQIRPGVREVVVVVACEQRAARYWLFLGEMDVCKKLGERPWPGLHLSYDVCALQTCNVVAVDQSKLRMLSHSFHASIIRIVQRRMT